MMRIARMLVSACLVVVMSACQSVPEDRESWLINTSLVTLLANPSQYDNIHVETTGFLTDAGGPVVFLTRDHAKAYDIASGIPLTVPDEKRESLKNSSCYDKFVRFLGRFVVEHEYVGKIIQVQAITDAFTNKTCWHE